MCLLLDNDGNQISADILKKYCEEDKISGSFTSLLFISHLQGDLSPSIAYTKAGQR